MKIKEGFILREISDMWVAVPIGMNSVVFNRLLSLSESAASIWKMLEVGAEIEDLVKAVLSEYNVDEETAREDIMGLINYFSERDLLIK